MKRLTTNKPVSEMDMLELAHNDCYAINGHAYYRDCEINERAREFCEILLINLANSRGFDSDEEFDEYTAGFMEESSDTLEGVIMLLYREIWSKANLYERLKAYEDTGLTPEQIREMDKLYLEKCEEVNRCKFTIGKLEEDLK